MWHTALDLVAVLPTLVHEGKELRLLRGQGQGHQLDGELPWGLCVSTVCVDLGDHCWFPDTLK